MPYLGSLAKLVSFAFAFGQGDSKDPTVVMLNRIETHLFRIEDKLDDFQKICENGHTIKEYKQMSSEIGKFQSYFELHVQANFSYETKQMLKDLCLQNNMLNFALYIESEMTKTIKQNLKSLIIKDFDMKLSISWGKTIATGLSKAMALNSVCISVLYKER